MSSIEVETVQAQDYFESGDLPLCVFRMPLHSGGKAMQTHDFHEIMIVTKGTATHCVNGEDCLLLPGDVYVLRPGDRHEIITGPSATIAEVNVLFDLERLNLDLHDIGDIPGYEELFAHPLKLCETTGFTSRLRLNPEALRTLLDLVDALEYEQAKELPGYRLKSINLFLDLLLFLSRAYSKTDRLNTQQTQHIAAAVAIIEDNFADALTVEDLTRQVHCSATQLRRIFQLAYGMSPSDYITRTRLNHGILLLRDSELDVTTIAHECGYNDSSYFTRAFRKGIGLAPTAYRKQQML